MCRYRVPAPSRGHPCRVGRSPLRGLYWWAAAVLMGGATLYYGLCRAYAFDDAFYLILSEELYLGSNPYEIYHFYPPGLFVAVAGWFSLLGHGVQSGRLFAWFMMVVNAVLLSLSAPKLSNAARCWFGLGAFALLWLCEASLVMTEIGIVTFGALGLLALQRTSGRPLIGGILAGFFFAVALAFKQVAVAYPLGVLAACLAQGIFRKLPWRQALAQAASHAAGFALGVILLWLLMRQFGSNEVLLDRLVWQPYRHYPVAISAYEAVFFAARVGWIILITTGIIVLGIWRRRILNEHLVACASVLTFLLLLYPFSRRLQAHHLMASLPAMAVLIPYGWDWSGLTWASAKRWLLPAMLVLVLLLGVGGYLKRARLVEIFKDDTVSRCRDVAMAVGQHIDSADDRTLFLDGGLGGLHPVATYYYTGTRPVVPFLAEPDLPKEITQLWFRKLSGLLEKKTTKVVVFDPGNWTKRLEPDLKMELDRVLNGTFQRTHGMGPGPVWIRRDEAVRHGPQIFRGPYANQAIR